ncbi:unnamed protein product [Rotaria magnacalcarata]|uniref:Uncharacterized protein n=1 Tax=Rotaria magnacalcarata TaxID=392030 RepID=A0A815DHT5_9BILA|nr:unnamed protein product [Rotaria magnacalcarata]CAF1333968.1 unnamed protein product [Rotaria magnacalcarata]CAF2012864.1 unnamed protein product [Rotaria magnacalcarata]CAF2097159.1 unnamed protein product [Rotaria magnacalcarata]CAF2208286.1 unnamed protein product [Rotaria magnacalcarata]
MITNQLIYLLFIILLLISSLGALTGDSMDSSDDDGDDDNNLVYTRARRQLKKFAYADPCEVACVTKKLHTKVPIKVLAKRCKDACKDKVSKFIPAIYNK